MKKFLSLILSLSMTLSLLSGCATEQKKYPSISTEQSTTVTESVKEDHPTTSNSNEDENNAEAVNNSETDSSYDNASEPQNELDWEEDLKFTGMSDTALLPYIENTVYIQLIKDLNSSNYYVENVSAVYVSQEYLQELAYNSQMNVFFGYSLAELDSSFEGTRYVFTPGDDGQTSVEPLQVVEDNTYERILKNVAVGTGVILVCVTVSCLSGIAGASAAAMIFAVAAKTGAVCALSGSMISGVSAAVVKGYQTGDLNEALKAGALGASEGYKWGAITGAISGGASKAWELNSATRNGLTMNEAAMIQYESGYPLSVIKQFHTFKEYTVFRDAGVQAEIIGDKLALVRTNIDLYHIFDEYGRNNYSRLSQGLNPIDGTGKTFEWHHIGQENNATLALLTSAEHDNGALHGFKVVSAIDRDAFRVYKKKVLNIALLKWLLTI